MIPGVKPAAIKAAEKKPAPKPPPNYVEVHAQRPVVTRSSVFSRPLKQATKENLETGGRLQQYRQEHPSKPGFFGKVLRTIGAGEHFLGHVGSSAIHAIEELPGASGSSAIHGI